MLVILGVVGIVLVATFLVLTLLWRRGNPTFSEADLFCEDTELQTDSFADLLASSSVDFDEDDFSTPVLERSPTEVDVAGKVVDFPTEGLAVMVRKLLNSSTETVVSAATAAGYRVEHGVMENPVATTDIRPGDVVVSGRGSGVFLGDGKVLLEGLHVTDLTDLTDFHGAFRPTEPDTAVPTYLDELFKTES